MVILTLGFAFGVWLLQQQATLPGFSWAWLLVGVPLVFFIPERSKPQRLLRSVILLGFSMGLGFYHADWQALQRMAVVLPDSWQGRDIEVIGVVADLPRKHEHGQRFSFVVENILTPQASVPQHIYLSTYLDSKTKSMWLKAGERWRLKVRLKQPHGSSNPYGFDFEAWALENDFRAVGYVYNKADNVRLDALAGGLFYLIDSLREKVRDRIISTLGDAPFSGILCALTIGDQGSIPAAQWQVFTRTGVNHLMSISGLHITMLAGLGFALAYWLWRRSARLVLVLPARKAASFAALLTALIYALLSGFAIPAQRTVYMVAAVTVALWMNRNFSPAQILCFALLGVLLPDPWAVISPGFWLSFGAVALILYTTAYRTGPRHFLVEYANVQWAMSIGLIPLLLGLFQQVSLVSPFANAVAIPLVSLVVVPLALLGAVLPLDTPLWLAHRVMGWTMSFLDWLNDLPQVVWIQHAPPAWSVVVGMLGVLLILLPRGFPARWLGFVLLLPMFLNKPDLPAQGSLRLIIFDVGQGLAVAAQTRHHALLYDTGPDFSDTADSGNRILIPSLRAMGIAKLDGLILTHDDTDHTGGAISVLQAMPINWVSSSLPEAHPVLQNFHDNRRCEDGQTWQWDGVTFEMLHPDAASYKETNIRDNNRGCVLRISIDDYHILLTADIEKDSEQRLLKKHPDKMSAQMLVVPHHGSRTSSTHEFIVAVHPVYAVFTVGYRNRFGHPKQEVVQRYLDSGANLLFSDSDGALLIGMDSQKMQVERYRNSHHRYWMHTPTDRPHAE